MTLGLIQTNDGKLDLACDEAGGLGQGDELQAALLLSLLTNRRAQPDDNLVDRDTNFPNRGGWWADRYATVPLGSLLWLRDRNKPTDLTKMQMTADARQALDWLLSDKIARDLSVQVELVATNPQNLRGMSVKMEIVIRRANGDDAKFDYFLGGENV